MSGRNDFLVIVSIDIGTTGSGYAFEFKHDLERDIDARKASMPLWNNDYLPSPKTATAILLNPKKEFDEFGFEAENKYANLKCDDEHKGWYYFQNFKLLLHDKKDLNRNTVLKDLEGKEMLAMTIFTMSIRYLKTHFQRFLSQRTCIESEILWVLTVPGIWNDSAKQFMREAAQNAGISGERLVIALDTEAAIMLFKDHVLRERTSVSSCVVAELLPGTKILVVDDGGGLVDTSVFKIQDDGTFCQIHAASGGGWGCIQVDSDFTQLLIKIVGANVMLKFKKTEDYVDLCRELEVKKRNFSSNYKDRIVIRIPNSLCEIYESMTGENLCDAVTQTSYGIQLSLKGNKMIIHSEVMESLFQPLIHDLTEHIHGLFLNPNIQDTGIIFMVGGFSKAPILQEAVKREFPDKCVIVPRNAELAALLGGILYGYQPSTISARISRYTYGIEGVRKFKPSDPLSKKKMIGGKEMCINVFSKHVEIGETLMADQSKPELRYTPSTHDQIIAFCLYSSTSCNPVFVTDSSCHYLGKLTVDMPKVNGRASKKCGIFVKLIFYDTEIKVEARNELTNHVTSAMFNFLD